MYSRTGRKQKINGNGNVTLDRNNFRGKDKVGFNYLDLDDFSTLDYLVFFMDGLLSAATKLIEGVRVN